MQLVVLSIKKAKKLKAPALKAFVDHKSRPIDVSLENKGGSCSGGGQMDALPFTNAHQSPSKVVFPS